MTGDDGYFGLVARIDGTFFDINILRH